MLPWAYPRWHIDWFSCFCTRHVTVIGHVGACPSPQNFPFLWGSGPHLVCGSLGPPDSASQTASRLIQPFLHSSRQTVPILYKGRPFPKKLPLLVVGDLDTHLKHDSLGLSKPTTQTASRSVQPLLQGSYCNRLTDHANVGGISTGQKITHNKPQEGAVLTPSLGIGGLSIHLSIGVFLHCSVVCNCYCIVLSLRTFVA